MEKQNKAQSAKVAKVSKETFKGIYSQVSKEAALSTRSAIRQLFAKMEDSKEFLALLRKTGQSKKTLVDNYQAIEKATGIGSEKVVKRVVKASETEITFIVKPSQWLIIKYLDSLLKG